MFFPQRLSVGKKSHGSAGHGGCLRRAADADAVTLPARYASGGRMFISALLLLGV